MIEPRAGRRSAWGDRFALVLLFVAWFAQSAGAVLHERLMPRRGVADVFCGIASDETLRSFRANAPSELLVLLAKRRNEANRSDALCDLCIGVHAQLAAGPTASPPLFALVGGDEFVRALAEALRAQSQWFAFEARGPPVPS